MKLFSALLLASAVALPAAAQTTPFPGNGPKSGNDVFRQGDQITRTGNGDNRDNQYSGTRSVGNRNVTIDGKGNTVNTGARNVDRSNNAEGGKGGSVRNSGNLTLERGAVRGGRGGEGGTGYGGDAEAHGGEGGRATIERGAVRNRNNNEQGQDQSQSSRNSNRNSSESNNRNRNRSNSRSAANNNGNSQSTTVNTGGNSYTEYGDLPETAIAPLGQSAGSGVIGDIAVPLPTISAGGFASGSDYGDLYGGGNNSSRSDYGVSIGINIPLGAGEFRDAARREIARRDQVAQAEADRNLFRLVQEAQWLRQQGLLNQEAHPRHWAALYGTTAEKFVF
ncbi:hypothetical protein [Synechococcus phage ME01]